MVECFLMVRHKRKSRAKHWHHRVPDFKLVYCGPKKSTSKKEMANVQKIRMVDAYVANIRSDSSVNEWDKEKKSGKSIKLH